VLQKSAQRFYSEEAALPALGITINHKKREDTSFGSSSSELEALIKMREKTQET
jgi:hypothetical protein